MTLVAAGRAGRAGVDQHRGSRAAVGRRQSTILFEGNCQAESSVGIGGRGSGRGRSPAGRQRVDLRAGGVEDEQREASAGGIARAAGRAGRGRGRPSRSARSLSSWSTRLCRVRPMTSAPKTTSAVASSIPSVSSSRARSVRPGSESAQAASARSV